MRHGVPGLISAASLLGNDSDPDSPAGGFAIASVTAGTGGTVALTASGNVIFTPQAGFLGTGGFSYRLTDGEGGLSAPRAVTVDV